MCDLCKIKTILGQCYWCSCLYLCYSLRSFLVYMLNIFAIFCLLLAPIDGVIPFLFQSVHRLFFCVYIYLQGVHVHLTSETLWMIWGLLAYPGSLKQSCLTLLFWFELVCLSCFCLGFLGFFFALCQLLTSLSSFHYRTVTVLVFL